MTVCVDVFVMLAVKLVSVNHLMQMLYYYYYLQNYMAFDAAHIIEFECRCSNSCSSVLLCSNYIQVFKSRVQA